MPVNRTWVWWTAVSATFLASALASVSLRAADAGKIDFNRDIRPILSDNCYACHGPDENKRKGGLRLDRKEDAFAKLKSGKHALVAGDPKSSTLVERLKTADPDELMPPPEGGRKLTAQQIELLTRWVEQGAPWQGHWSFMTPERPAVPRVKAADWPRNEVDRFVLAELEEQGLKPEPEADKATLIRRASLDLTGLPPTIEEVDAFLADSSPGAYEKVVDRLLASSHYGERMTQNWMDLARFADSNGYHFDGVRFMWLWRDQVIGAFNQNQPYDQFTVEQLAGDLLPNATTSQRIASGFMRNGMTNDEGGADPDEYLNKYMVDRVNTLGITWLGLTVGCSECHDHKYDPMSTREFYRLYAFFHNVPEKGLDRTRVDNPPPRLPVPTPEQSARLVELEFSMRDWEKTFTDRSNELGETQEKWERETQSKPPEPPSEVGQLAKLPFEGALVAQMPEGTPVPTPTLNTTNAPVFVPGRLGQGLKLDGKSAVDYGQSIPFERTNAFSFAAWVRFEGDGAVWSKMEKGPGYRGVDLLVADRRFQTHWIHQWPENALKVKTREQFPANQWMHVLVSYDGTAKASGIKMYVNGRARDLETEKDQLKDSVVTPEPLRLGSRNGESFFTGIVDDARFFSRVLSSEEAAKLTFHGFMPIVAKSRGTRSDEERSELQRYYKEVHALDYLRSEEGLAKARRAREELVGQIPTAMVMAEMDKPRDTHILVRGDFRSKGEKVTAGTPAFLPSMPEGAANRLTLARWLVAKNHPLTSRVTANRWWAMIFGTGLVKTLNDFGSQGEWPSHPELLDWLAVQLREGGPVGQGPASGPWDVKGFVRMLVTSATYRQAASVSPAKLERDLYNRLLSRGPRVRLEAEFVRDNALAVSGLLNRKIGGTSVKPYQPSGIWDGTDARYDQDHGDALYRRGMYVFWKRSAHYPSFATFDAPSREVCTFVRQRTQTPLQSLVLMNDPVYVEAARGLAQRVLKEEPKDLNRQLVRAFRHTLGRPPQPEEIAVLQRAYDQQKAEFQSDAKSAESFLKVGESKVPENSDPIELASLTAVANVLLNLNEAITK